MNRTHTACGHSKKRRGERRRRGRGSEEGLERKEEGAGGKIGYTPVD